MDQRKPSCVSLERVIPTRVGQLSSSGMFATFVRTKEGINAVWYVTPDIQIGELIASNTIDQIPSLQEAHAVFMKLYDVRWTSVFSEYKNNVAIPNSNSQLPNWSFLTIITSLNECDQGSQSVIVRAGNKYMFLFPRSKIILPCDALSPSYYTVQLYREQVV